jgi:hypothetical protein
MYGGMRKASDSPEWFCIKCDEQERAQASQALKTLISTVQ